MSVLLFRGGIGDCAKRRNESPMGGNTYKNKRHPIELAINRLLPQSQCGFCVKQAETDCRNQCKVVSGPGMAFLYTVLTTVNKKFYHFKLPRTNIQSRLGTFVLDLN